MASPKVLAKQTAARENLAQRIAEVSRPEVIQRYIYGSLAEYRGGGGRPEACRVSVVQNDGTGAATIEFETEDRVKVFAKLYADDGTGAAHGAHSHQVLQALWNDGFGPGSRYRVAEPLGFFPESNMLLLRGADGTLVASAQGEAELATGAREAARWLVRLHNSPVRVGEARYPLEVYHKLMHRIAKAAAQHPDQVEQLIELSDRFDELAQRVKPHFVQAHGQYRHIHVFVGLESVTVIDLDRSKPADPAKDLAEFLHRMRTKRFKASAGASRAEEATQAFLEEYGSQLPANLANLPFYWGYHTLVSLWRFMKAGTPADREWQPLTEYYLSEFERATTQQYLVKGALG